MKSILFGLAVLATSTAFAAPKATLRIPMILDLDGNNDKPVTAAVVNPKLVKAGVKPLPLFIELSSDDRDAYKKVSAVNDLVMASLTKIGYKDGDLATGYVPGDLDVGTFTTCFTGDATLVADLTKSVTDVVYSDQYGIHAWKYKKITKNDEGDALDQETLDFLNNESSAFKNWNTNQDAVLILSHVGDDGDDVSESVIKRCK